MRVNRRLLVSVVVLGNVVHSDIGGTAMKFRPKTAEQKREMDDRAARNKEAKDFARWLEGYVTALRRGDDHWMNVYSTLMVESMDRQA